MIRGSARALANQALAEVRSLDRDLFGHQDRTGDGGALGRLSKAVADVDSKIDQQNNKIDRQNDEQRKTRNQLAVVVIGAVLTGLVDIVVHYAHP